ncbi:MAG TPA: hypothetical protein VEB22_09425 [Phycisphaerales bacterium]|nr:hypothetical protein [Phycisphaerales bacterium]
MKLALAVVACAAWVAATGCASLPVGGAAGELLQESLNEGEKFAVYVPPGEAPAGGWPCIVFLNGSGECGTDGRKQTTVGLMPAVWAASTRWPFVIVLPQKPTRESKWLDHKELMMACLNAAKEQWSIDEGRIYLTGLSQGGNGTWEIAAAYPGLFAAVAPVCGYVDPQMNANRWEGDGATIAEAVLITPVWAFHGACDDVVPAAQTRRMVAALDALAVEMPGPRKLRAVQVSKDDGTRSPLRITIYPDLDHGCWDRAYREAGLPEWFLRFGPAETGDRPTPKSLQ